MKVTPYVPKPMICDRCHKLGHTKNRCKHYADQRCDTCGEKAHITEKIIGPRPGQTETTIEKITDPCPYENAKWCANFRETGSPSVAPGHCPQMSSAHA